MKTFKTIGCWLLVNTTILLYTGFFAALVWVLFNKGDYEVSAMFTLIWLVTVVGFMIVYEKERKK